MKWLFTLLALAAFAPVAEAGPIRDRLRARFAPRPAAVVQQPAPVAVARPAPVPFAPVAAAACSGGACALPKR